MSGFGKYLVCPECGRVGKRVRRWTLKHGSRGPNDWVYTCPSCDVYVGCHPGTDMPLGTMANRVLRLNRRRAHNALDWAWKTRRMTRNQAYAKLAEVLEIPPGEAAEKAHVAMLDDDQCQTVVAAFDSMRPWKMPHR